EAACAYDKAALEAYGGSALLNHSIEQVLTWNPPARMLRKTNTSGYRGVRKVGKDHWYAQIHINKEQNIYLGTFNSPGDAARVYDRAAVDHWGNQAKLNFPLDEVLAWENLPRPLSSNTSGYRGVTQIKRSGKWQASYRHGKKLLHLGTYDTAEDAAKAYDRAVIRLKGHRATTNFPLGDYDIGRLA
ncbi:MAG TPA: AP2/ERF family transcription factor, partial [Ktedonobacteraceae bacterium]